MFRYVCPNCLRTFIEKKKNDQMLCWNCGEIMMRIDKKEVFLG